jgi:hypothetical protein
MVGAGIAVGSLTGGHTNAARDDSEPAVAHDSLSIVSPASAAVIEIPKTTQTVREPAPATIVASRFPQSWGAPQPAAPAPVQQALAYVAEPDRDETAQATASASAADGYSLAGVDPAPPLPRARAPRKNSELFNDAQLASIKLRLRLTPQQEQYWPQVEAALRAISFKAAQADARRHVRGGAAAMIDPNSPEIQQLKSAAIPLIMSMREDQKREVRQLAHTMGLSKVAAMF